MVPRPMAPPKAISGPVSGRLLVGPLSEPEPVPAAVEGDGDGESDGVGPGESDTSGVAMG